MKVSDVRQKYLDYFKALPRNHKQISAAPLVPENDPTTLFTSSGMQQLVPYLIGEKHAEGRRLVNSQPTIRLRDIEEVGDGRHTTYFEMLGNWSLGDYFKKDQLSWVWEFVTKTLGLPESRLVVSISGGGKGIPKDTESHEVWKKIGLSEDRIFSYPVTEENWWSRSGLPHEMPVGEIGGPDSELFFEFTQIKHDQKYGKECHPNCECSRYFEIGNSVFIQYVKKEDGSFEDLPQKNIDFGGGLERLTAVTIDNPDMFQIDILKPFIDKVEKVSSKAYIGNESSMQVIIDHIRAADALISEGVEPSNKLQGYVLRRLIRRSAIKMRQLKGDVGKSDLNFGTSEKINNIIENETDKFAKTLSRGLRQIEKIGNINAKIAFDMYQTYGFPLEITAELFEEKGQKIDKKDFEKEFEKHKEKSRTASSGIFKGGLADHSEETTRLHTATHLLHASLRKVLGEGVEQKGSNITSERMRFDFSHPQKLSDSEIKKVEDMVNKQVKKDLKVSSKTMSFKEAKKINALAFFGEKYREKVKVYTIGSTSKPFSREVCGGPHVENTGKIGHVKITKQEKLGAGLVRIYAKANVG